ncbi:type II secretory pathway protein [Pseudoalteromonas xiamenensis]|uniref:secretin N-terminal domain-containing protein n=1 Tax=Pseudoalteromonas xiamenensis TaxID=882626 RepID=UPI0027E592C2|nr:secretin N-terminal domain-containing protein [Pseudoalteromonas xiamenensis]WMN61208.1 type II secretory pathway protein [Pseudoalteromonas xiamenensis]
MKQLSKFSIFIITTLTLQGCQSVMDPSNTTKAKQVNIGASFLASDSPDDKSPSVTTESGNFAHDSEFERLKQLSNSSKNLKLELDLSQQFDNKNQLQVSANALPMSDFIHYALGELLNVSYVVEPTIKENTTPVTLELKTAVSARRFYQLVQEVLARNNVSISLNEGIFYIFPSRSGNTNSERAFGFGRSRESVPNVASEIIQLVPTKYGVSPGLRNSVAGLVDASVAIDTQQGLLTIQGRREQILRALDLISIIDSPALSAKSIALMNFTYIDSQTFIEKVSKLLQNEGISTSNTLGNASSLQFVPIEHLGKVVAFATADEIIDRVEFWAKQLDKPATGSEQSFFIYHPKYARASDLGVSLAPLLGATATGGRMTQSVPTSGEPRNNSSSDTVKGRTSSSKESFSIEGDNLKLVVDERANALIFYSSGKYYQDLQPILRQLDVMPKQVMMEVVIAEVKLTGSFAKGVQFALTSGPESSRQEKFNFSSKNGFSYEIVGLPGSVTLNLAQKDGQINVLSRPTLLVRDGVAANISVGDDIPTAGSTISDPINSNRETTTIQYRKTGVELNVTPTINAQGTVIMSIEQKISSVNKEASVGIDSPAIFERTISTEVVAGNGQTVLLGGLIRQEQSSGASSVPMMGSLPIIGHLFRSDESSSDKTELVVLVTPKIIQSNEDWMKVEQSFKKGLENLVF